MDAKYRFSGIWQLWMRVIFYSLIINIGFVLCNKSPLSLHIILNTFFPVCRNQYWYFTAYVGLYYVIPILNTALKSIEKCQLQKILIMIVIIYTGITTVFDDVFGLSYGFSTLWLIILYMIGGYFKLYQIEIKKTYLWLCGFISFSLLILFFRFILEIITFKITGMPKSGPFACYTSPLMLAESICLFMFFKSISLRDICKPIIRKISNLAFSVYLIHTAPLIYDNYIKDKFIALSKKNTVIELISVLGYSLAIFAVCILIDFIRNWLFTHINIQKNYNSRNIF